MGESKGTESFRRFGRHRLLRNLLRWLAKPVFWLLTDLTIEGEENIPKEGGMVVIANHFSFVDPAALVRILPRPIDFVGGAVNPHAPKIVLFLPRMWGYLPLYRGTGAAASLRVATQIIKDGGLLGIMPEGGNWANVLRPPRPGAAFLAAQTGAQILPIGLDGMENVFPSLAKLRRAKITVKVGKPFGPFKAAGKGRERRRQLDEFGHEMMRQIAKLIPPERRGYYSDDPAIRAAAKGTEKWPWDEQVEGEVEGRVM